MVPHHYNVWRWWVDSLYRAVPTLNRYFDGVAMHDFGPTCATSPRSHSGEPYQNFNRMRRIEDVRRQFMGHDAADKPFWIMEMGWSTCTERNIDCVSDAAAEGRTCRPSSGTCGTLDRSWVQAVFVYRFEDCTDREHRAGRIRPACAITTRPSPRSRFSADGRRLGRLNPAGQVRPAGPGA